MNILNQNQIVELQNLGISSPAPKINYLPFFIIPVSTTLIFAFLLTLKNNDSYTPLQSPTTQNSTIPTPTQVPKSIQHFLLSSQTYFSKSLELQQQKAPQTDIISSINQAILEATNAISEFPHDFRGYKQRAFIYQSLADSQPTLLLKSISDYETAFELNPSADLSYTLAGLYAKKGDANLTISYLVKTISLEPTKAQYFYDLARIQNQTGQITAALNTYNRLLPLVSNPEEKQTIIAEKDQLSSIISQNPNHQPSSLQIKPSEIKPSVYDDKSPLLQASTLDQDFVIASPDTAPTMSIHSLTDSNALSGESTLLASSLDITLDNSNLTSTSQVYLTPISGCKNQNFHLKSKSKDSFTVGLDSPCSENLKFKWWIIN